jgi:hypothetical protein
VLLRDATHFISSLVNRFEWGWGKEIIPTPMNRGAVNDELNNTRIHPYDHVCARRNSYRFNGFTEREGQRPFRLTFLIDTEIQVSVRNADMPKTMSGSESFAVLIIY